MQKLKELARRGTALIAAVGLLGGTMASVWLPSLASADALNPLTERTLLLSSSAPGYQNTDGAGNAYNNGVTTSYAPPNSGANGQKTGETFTFKSSTDSSSGPAVKAFTFQYCTTAAGTCQAPGDDTGNALNATPDRGSDVLTGSSPSSDLNVQIGNGTTTTAPSEIASIASLGTDGIPNPDGSEGTFAVEYSTNSGSTWTLSSGWSMAVSNLEDSTSVQTGKNNYITLTNSTGISQAALTEYKVVFFGTQDNYITNPGSGAFFVKINDYNSVDFQNFRDAYPDTANDCDADHTTYDATSGTTTCNQNVIDGGVTVANVMNQSIAIHTKVLETLEFSVGTVDPDTGSGAHAACDAITYGPNGDSVINLGNPNAENSLEVGKAYDAWSYWRLSSNSSNGATVYYSGNTLADTENDLIGAIYALGSGAPGDGSAGYSHTGSEQFGLGLDVNDNATPGTYVDDYADAAADTTRGNGTGGVDVSSSWTTALTNGLASDPTNWHAPQLYPLVPLGNYGLANGSIASNDTGAQFAFSSTANTIPVPIAGESTQVVNCSTGLMRYIGNIAATTPAGIYTTKINYLAAPEY